MVCLYTLIRLETGSFTVSEHKTKILVACQNKLPSYLSKVNSVTINLSVTVHKK